MLFNFANAFDRIFAVILLVFVCVLAIFDGYAYLVMLLGMSWFDARIVIGAILIGMLWYWTKGE